MSPFCRMRYPKSNVYFGKIPECTLIGIMHAIEQMHSVPSDSIS